jgi:hypothetical protein
MNIAFLLEIPKKTIWALYLINCITIESQIYELDKLIETLK